MASNCRASAEPRDRRPPRRTVARRVALQLLYEAEQRDGLSDERVAEFLRRFAPRGDVGRYCRTLVDGVLRRRSDLDRRLAPLCENWAWERVSPVEKTILRIAAFELLEMSDVPPRVVLNEAIELAKRFASPDAASFVNGVLDALLRSLRTDAEDDPSSAAETDGGETQIQ